MPEHNVKKRITSRDIPEDLGEETADTIARIEEHPTVVGILYLRKNAISICTVPESMAQTLTKKLPELNDSMHRAITEITVVINNVNPMIDRIMEDDSVEGVVMTNKEGSPILTNISSTRATTIGLTLQPFGSIAQTSIKELDPFDEVLIARIHTKRVEIMLAPHPEFNIIVVQHGRSKLKDRKLNKLKHQ